MPQFRQPAAGTQPTPVQSVSHSHLKRVILIALVCLIALSVLFIWHFSAGSPAPVGTWTKTHTYNGNGVYRTDTLTLSDEWRIQWACSTAETAWDASPLQIAVYRPDGSLAIVALNTICGGNNTSGLIDIHQGGTIYLLITSTAIWSFSIQERQ